MAPHSNIRRLVTHGHYFFITCVTYNRLPILLDHFDAFRHAVSVTMSKADSAELVWVILPDHYHAIIHSEVTPLPDVVHGFKISFTKLVKRHTGATALSCWQRGYWDHVIRDEEDFRRHTDYIHYNPVRHGLAECPWEWEKSSFREFVARGQYAPDWNVDVGRRR